MNLPRLLARRATYLVRRNVGDDVCVKRIELATFWVADARAAPTKVPRGVRHPHRRHLVPLRAIDRVAALAKHRPFRSGRVVPERRVRADVLQRKTEDRDVQSHVAVVNMARVHTIELLTSGGANMAVRKNNRSDLKWMSGWLSAEHALLCNRRSVGDSAAQGTPS